MRGTSMMQNVYVSQIRTLMQPGPDVELVCAFLYAVSYRM